MDFFQKHQAILEKAIHAIHDRSFFTPYPENPSPKIYGAQADEDGKQKFDNTFQMQEGFGWSPAQSFTHYLKMQEC